MRHAGDVAFALRRYSLGARLNLLFLGDTNRVVAETPMNDVSTRILTGLRAAMD